MSLATIHGDHSGPHPIATKYYYMRVATRRWTLRLAAEELGLHPRRLADIEWGREEPSPALAAMLEEFYAK